MANGAPTPGKKPAQPEKQAIQLPGLQVQTHVVAHAVSVVELEAAPDEQFLAQRFHSPGGGVVLVLTLIEMVPQMVENIVGAMEAAQTEGLEQTQRASGLVVAKPGQEHVEAKLHEGVRG